MTNFRRWVDGDEAPPHLRELLRTAQIPAPLGASARARSRRRVTGLLAVPAASGALAWASHAALGALLGATVTAAVTLPRALSPLHPVPELPTPATPPQKASHAEVRVSRQATPAADIESQSTKTPAAAAFPAVAPGPHTGAQRTEPAPPDLTRETALLERAQRLVAGDPAEALRLVHRHEVEFPEGALETEREFLAIEALVKLGRRAEAESRARALKARSPGNLYNVRLDHLFSESSGEGH